jgi:polysaccharide pyruvyl transferase CsaB
MGKRLLLAGYFGHGNLGDDAILMGFHKLIEGSGHETRTLAGSPERLMRNYGLVGVPKMDMTAVKQAISQCDALVFPGGSVFQDVTSVRSVLYYSNLVKMAKKEGKKVVLLGQGVGPLNRWLGKKFAVQAFNMADAIAVRDPESVSALRALGVRHNPRVTADMAFLLPKPAMAEESQSFNVGGMKTVGVSARPWGKDKNKTVVEVFGGVMRKLTEMGYAPFMLCLDEEEDGAVINAIAKTMGGKVPDLKGVNSPMALQTRLMRMDAVIAMRLHAGILAATVDVPPYLVSYDPKVNALANALGYSTPPTMQGITVDRIVNGFTEFIKDRDRLAAGLATRRERLKQEARSNLDVLQSVVGD